MTIRPLHDLREEFDGDFIQPEPRPAAGEESQMSAMAGVNETQKRVGSDGRVPEHFKGNEGVVLRLDEQRRHTDPVEIALRRLRRVIMIRAFKTE